MIHDPFNAFCTHADVAVAGAPTGPLAGLTFAAKDNYDVAGHPTGGGSPDWLRTHGPAERTAPAVQALLDAGAGLVGKTRMDELAFSLVGRNAHYGTPVNPKAPGRIPGGSSSGSVAATAGGVVDFALGTDTAGSVRVPAHNCGVYGFRPTHGRIPLDGIVPFSPSFDTVGWFARDAALLRRVGRVLLPADGPPPSPTRLLVGDDLFALADAEVRAALAPLVPRVAGVVGPAEHLTVSPQGPGAWVEPFDALRKAEVRGTLGGWVERVRPQLGPATQERILQSFAVTDEEVARALEARQQVRRRLDELLAPGVVLCLPTAPLLAPPRDSTDAVLDVYRTRTLQLSCLAPAGGLPQVSLPLAVAEGCPVGLSLIAGRGQDALLWDLAVAVEGKVGRG